MSSSVGGVRSFRLPSSRKIAAGARARGAGTWLSRDTAFKAYPRSSRNPQRKVSPRQDRELSVTPLERLGRRRRLAAFSTGPGRRRGIDMCDVLVVLSGDQDAI